MAGTRAAIRYAKAVLSLASDNKSETAVNSDMKLIAKTIAEHNDLKNTLLSPVVTNAIKKTVLLEIFKGTNKETISLINTLVANNRVSIIEDVAKKYSALYDASKGIEVAIVTTAVPLNDALKAQVLSKAKALTGKDVEVKNIVDKDVIGGFILRIGDMQYNASIANQLNKLKQEFSIN